MNTYLKLSQHFICRKNSKLLSFTSIVSILGVAFGVCAFLVVITVLNSFQNELKRIILSVNPNLVIYSEQGVAQFNLLENKLNSLIGTSVRKKSPFIYQESILNFKDRSFAIYIRAITGNQSANSDALNSLITPVGAINTISAIEASKLPNIILGRQLANDLKVHVGDVVTLLNFKNSDFAVRYIKVKVSGLIHIGISQYDKQYGLMNFYDAQKIFGHEGWASGIEMSLIDPNLALNIAKNLNDKLNYYAVPWQHIDQDLFNQVERDGMSIKLIVLIISFVAGFNIIITLSLTVNDKVNQISLLRCLGAQKKHIISVFVFSGVILGVFGATVGLCIAYVILKIFAGLSIGSFNDFYYLEKIPVQVDFNLIIIAFLTAILLSFLGALYPAWRAARISPLEGLKQ